MNADTSLLAVFICVSHPRPSAVPKSFEFVKSVTVQTGAESGSEESAVCSKKTPAPANVESQKMPSGAKISGKCNLKKRIQFVWEPSGLSSLNAARLFIGHSRESGNPLAGRAVLDSRSPIRVGDGLRGNDIETRKIRFEKTNPACRNQL